VNSMRPNILELFQAGITKLAKEHQEKEKDKVGILRAGNTGILMPDGAPVGKCTRLTYLRYKGIEVEEHSQSTHLMFASGFSNEDHWVDVLTSSYPHKILKEEEVPISWTTASGVLVTGRPDLVLLDSQEKPLLGIELKQASSLWTVRDMLNQKPKTMHLMQAAHYSWKLGVPFELWYTSRAHFAVTSKESWMLKQFPKQGQFGSQFCEYNPKGEIKKVLPFMQGYELAWDERGQLKARAIPQPGQQEQPWVFTIITQKGIENYYEKVATMEAKNELGKRPANLEADGSKSSFSICNYCPVQNVCDNWEKKGLKVWEEAVRNTPIKGGSND
jgi:YD repeat-containing protein